MQTSCLTFLFQLGQYVCEISTLVNEIKLELNLVELLAVKYI